MTDREFETHGFRAGERFKVVNDWALLGREGRLVSIDFEHRTMLLVLEGLEVKFRAEQVEPVGA